VPGLAPLGVQLARNTLAGGGSSAVAAGGPAAAASFEAESIAWFKQWMPQNRLNRSVGSDLKAPWEVALSAANPPTVPAANLTSSGGILTFPAAASQFALNPTAPGATTYAPILALYASRGAPWGLRGRALLKFSAFSNGTVALLSLDGGLANPTHKIQLVSNPTLSAQQTYIRLQGATGGPADYSTGPDGLLGGTGSQLGVNVMCTFALFFDDGRVRWNFGDQYNPLNVLDGTLLSVPDSGGAAIRQLDYLLDDGQYASAQCSDTVSGPLIYYDALALVYGASVETR
jgi:hypothetical protein